MENLESHIEAILNQETERERQVARLSAYIVANYVSIESAATDVIEARDDEVLRMLSEANRAAFASKYVTLTDFAGEYLLLRSIESHQARRRNEEGNEGEGDERT